MNINIASRKLKSLLILLVLPVGSQKYIDGEIKMKTFIAMNRFKIAIGREEDFEDIWRNRETHLDDVGGFKKFNLLKGPTNEEYTLYTSHSTWDSKTDFENWTKSEAFRKAHSGGGQHNVIQLGHPQFEGFEVIL